MKLTPLLLLLLAFVSSSSTVEASVARAATPKKRLGGNAKAKPSSRGAQQLQAAQSSRQLKKVAPKMNPKDAINYGDQIFIQNAGHYRRILVGNVHKKSKKKKKKKYWNPYTYDVWERKTPDLDSKWEILSYSSSGGGVPRDCVRYGDTILFKMVKSVDRPYLGCGSGDGDRDATSWAWNNDKEHHKGFKWVIRSDPGKTGSATRVDDDPAHGMCVVDLSKAMVQSFRAENRWLKGCDSKETDDVWVKDIYDGDELAAADKYMWIFRKDKALGHQDEGIQCLATAATGVWNYLATATGGDYTVTYTQGNTRTKDRSETKEKNWSLSVSLTVEANFAFGSASSTVTGTGGGSASETVSNSLAQNEDVSIASTFYEKGVVWQYAIKMKDLCVPDWEVTTKEIFMTASQAEPPCCLPGQFYDLERPHGPCMKGTPCQCDKETCEAFEVEMKAIEEEEAAAAAEEEDSGSSEEGSYSSEEESESYESESESYSESYESESGDGDGGGDDVVDDDDAWLQELIGGQSGYDDMPMYDDFYGGYNDDLGGYQDDYFDDDFATNGPYGPGGMYAPPPTTPPKFMYNGDQQLFALNINQANKNNNGAGLEDGTRKLSEPQEGSQRRKLQFSYGGGGSAQPQMMANNDGPLFSLNINQENTNNNGAGFTPQGGDGNVNNNPYYGYPDDDGELEDDFSLDDFTLDDDAQNGDDYLDVVVDAVESLTDGRRTLRGA